MSDSFPTKTALTLATFAVMVMAPKAVPTLANYQSLDEAKIRAVLDFPGRKQEIQIIPMNPIRANKTSTKGLSRAPKIGNLLDPTNELDAFYNALDQGGVTHILHYGDSPTTADLITADARQMFQHQFGDGGIGFMLLAKPWAWYNRRGVEMTSSNWIADIGGLSVIKDGKNGLGAVSFRGHPGSLATWKLRDHKHSSVEIAYLAEPGAGAFAIDADGVEIATTQAASDKVESAYFHASLPEGTSTVSLRVTEGTVRIYGTDFRKQASGVVYSSLGVNGANVTLLSRAFNAEHLAGQLEHYQPSLVIINYGTNESGFSDFVDTTWGGELKRVLARVRAAVPNASILLMSPMDRGAKNETGEITTLPALPRLVEMEQRVALEQNVAFFNTFEAMGGEGTMARWYSSEPRLVGADFIHPMPAGARIVGELLYGALREGFNQHKVENRMANLPVEPKEERRP